MKQSVCLSHGHVTAKISWMDTLSDFRNWRSSTFILNCVATVYSQQCQKHFCCIQILKISGESLWTPIMMQWFHWLVSEVNALDFNVQEMQIYWTDTSLKSINRAFLNGSQIERLVVVDLPHPDGLAVDWIAKNLYWTDSKHQRIEVARLNGQHRKMLIWRDLWKPRELAVNPVSG